MIKSWYTWLSASIILLTVSVSSACILEIFLRIMSIAAGLFLLYLSYRAWLYESGTFLKEAIER